MAVGCTRRLNQRPRWEERQAAWDEPMTNHDEPLPNRSGWIGRNAFSALLHRYLRSQNRTWRRSVPHRRPDPICLRLGLGGLLGGGRRLTLAPGRTRNPWPSTIREQPFVKGDDTGSNSRQSVSRLDPEGGVALRLARDTDPPPQRLRSGRRRFRFAREEPSDAFELHRFHAHTLMRRA